MFNESTLYDHEVSICDGWEGGGLVLWGVGRRGKWGEEMTENKGKGRNQQGRKKGGKETVE